MRLGLAGDWHGNTAWAMDSVQRLAVEHAISTVLHAGDFGIWPNRPVRGEVDVNISVVPGLPSGQGVDPQPPSSQ